MTQFPVALDLRGRRVLVVGAGTVAERKVAGLLDAGAEVDLVAPEATDTLRELAAAGRLRWRQRAYEADDLADAWLVLACTDRPAVNQTVAADAAARRVWCNVAAPATAGDCHLLATVQRGPVTIAIGTGGGSPYAARRLRELVEAAVPEELGALVALMAELREAVLARYDTETERRAAFERMWTSPAAALLAAGDVTGAREALLACLA